MPKTQVKIHTVVSLPFSENTYIAHLEGRDDCIVVDPGFDSEPIIRYIESHELTPAAILLTHGHVDHIAGNAELKERWPDCPLVIGRNEASKLTNATHNGSALFGMPLTSPPADRLLDDGEHVSTAGFNFEVREIPGHSSGHVVFIWREHDPPYVFGGDVLFAGSIGRTDLPGGNFEQLAHGIHAWLFTLPDATIVLSGHGEPTTTGHERKTNPFVGENAARFDG